MRVVARCESISKGTGNYTLQAQRKIWLTVINYLEEQVTYEEPFGDIDVTPDGTLGKDLTHEEECRSDYAVLEVRRRED